MLYCMIRAEGLSHAGLRHADSLKPKLLSVLFAFRKWQNMLSETSFVLLVKTCSTTKVGAIVDPFGSLNKKVR